LLTLILYAIASTAAMIEDSLLPFSFPAVGRKKIMLLSTAGASLRMLA
jgi:hypothetical protein